MVGIRARAGTFTPCEGETVAKTITPIELFREIAEGRVPEILDVRNIDEFEASKVEGKTIDIGSGELVSIRNVVENLVRLINPAVQPVVGALAERPFEQVRKANVAVALAHMGWEPKTSLKEGLENTVNWFRQEAKEA